MSGGSVQFRGIAQVMTAYNNRFADNATAGGWSIFCKNQFMFKGIGDDTLKTMLKTLYGSSSNSVYTLKIFEDAKSLRDIKEKTECDGSFNFRFHVDEDEMPNAGYTTAKSLNGQVMQGINAINARLDMIEQAKEEEEKEGDKKPSALGFIGELMQTPGVGPVIGQLLQQVVGSVFKGQPAVQNYQRPGAIAGPPATTFSEVITELQKYDPALLVHLNKLLAMAQEKPQNFSFLLQTLDSM